MIALLLDQGLARRTASDLRQFGWDATHVGEIGLGAAPDTEIVDRAIADSRVIVTLDSDFSKILAARQSQSPSVLHVRMEGLGRSALTSVLERVLPEIETELASGAIVAITHFGMRIRRLPLMG